MSVLINNIGELVNNVPDSSGPPGPGPFMSFADSALVIDAGRVAWTGPAARAPAADEMIDAAGRVVLPGFVDSHAHLVFAGERGAEFAARMAGLPYAAGGIRSTVAATRAATDDQLGANLRSLAAELVAQGTTTFECKSGYGLTVRDEARSVALAAEFTPEVTYLGAHVVPPEFAGDPGGYVDLACGAMLDACAPQARWVDVFCERGAFGPDEAAAVLAAGIAAGLQPRVHANQLGPGPGVQLAVRHGAASADHCTYLNEADVPGSCFSSSMPLCIALAVREMRMTTQEAVWAATAGGARALRRTDVGHLGIGARADLVMLDAPSHAYLAYRPGVPLVAAVWQAGRRAA